MFGDAVLEGFDVADDADQLIGTGKGSQGVDGFLQGVGVQRAKAFVHKQGIHADAAGTFLDGIADAKSQAERRQKAFAAGKGTDRAGLTGVGIEHIQLQCGLGGNIGALAAAQGILAARHAGKTTVCGGDHAVKIKALHILFKGQLLLLGQIAVDGLAQVIQHGGVGAAIVFDGKLAAYLLNPSASDYQAGQLAAEYAAAPAFACAAAPDAGALSALLDVLSTKLDEQGGHDLLATMELPLARVLADMERIGFAVDAEGIRQFGDSLRAELNGILQNIYAEVGYEFNLNSPKQLGEALFDKLGLPPRKKTARGYSTDAETLESLRAYSPAVDDILKYRTYSKLLSTYVEGLLKALGPDGRIHSTFIQTEARTGRISSTEPNLQNIPIRTELGSQLRAYFVAKPGCVLVDADYSQIELRILAHITGDEHMQQAFLNGEDIHRSTAAKIYGIPQSEVTPRLRSSAKAINFGIMYGKGAYSLSKDIGVTVKEADAFLKNYLAAFPSVSGYMDKTIADAKANGYVSTLFGRRRALPELNSNNHNIRASGERMARNTPIQGTAADVIKLAMVRVWKRLRDEKMESRLILTVHDELIVEAPEAEAEQAARILREEMEGCVQYAVPLSTDVHTGKNWLEAH